MKVTIAAIGRLKAGPERELVQRYIERAAKAGRGAGLDVAIREFPESRAARAAERRSAEAKSLAAAIPAGAAIAVLDEHGRGISTADFAALIGQFRDAGKRDLVLLIGGPDGLDDAPRGKAALVLSFGRMTLPHQIVRVLAAEQIYRAITILTGHPYHRA